jgi:NAD(P)-dependent dehydrogenase (short-subunit alcohol dehydrogenase family)
MKIAVITGGGRGIGKSTALELARRGIGVILTYKSHPDEGAAVAEQIRRAGGEAAALPLDTAQVGSFEAFAARVAEILESRWHRKDFDFLINNAGIGQRSLIKDTTEDLFDTILAVNFKGPFFLTQKLLPLMADGGHIINISSALARVTFPGVAVYGSLKAALETLTRYMAKEFASRRIRVNVVAPGAIDTEFGGGKGDAQTRKHIAEVTALGRLGEADDIGRFVAGLLAEDNSFMTAQRIEVSGGIAL